MAKSRTTISVFSKDKKRFDKLKSWYDKTISKHTDLPNGHESDITVAEFFSKILQIGITHQSLLFPQKWRKD